MNKALFNGKEWSLEPELLLKKVQGACEHGERIEIFTSCTLEQFQARMGIYSAKKVGKYDEIENSDMPRHDKDLNYIYIGQMILDYYIPSTYVIHCGNKIDGSYNRYEIRSINSKEED